jgi:hypothetical protein
MNRPGSLCRDTRSDTGRNMLQSGNSYRCRRMEGSFGGELIPYENWLVCGVVVTEISSKSQVNGMRDFCGTCPASLCTVLQILQRASRIT